jgi:hypothetical protein
MALTERNIDQILNLTAAYMQRLEEVQRIATALRSTALWRSTDGSLQIGAITDTDKANLTTRITQNLDEAELIIATTRGLLAEGGGS